MRVFRPVACLLLSTLLLAACGPEATPFPVALPAPAATTAVLTPNTLQAVQTTAGTPGTLRYALAANTAGLVDDMLLLEQSAQIETLDVPINPNDLGIRYDIIAAYGDLSGGQRSPVEHHIALVLNPTLPPMNNPEITNILKQAIDPQAILLSLNLPGAAPEPLVTASSSILRVELANAGWPDGFDVNLVYDAAPGANQIASMLQSINITVHAWQVDDLHAAFDVNPAQMALVSWTAPEERAEWGNRVGAENVIPLYTLPITYLAVEGLTISFTPSGWPLAHR